MPAITPKPIGKPIICKCFIFLSLLFVGVNAQSQQVAKIAAVDNLIRGKIANSNLSGLSIAIVHYDTVLMARGYGRDANDKPITANSLFPVASLSKAFTAAAVLQLVSVGKVNLDAPVVKYIPSFLSAAATGKTVTIRQLLNQTSGMGDVGYPEFTLDTQPRNLDDVVSNLRLVQLVSFPGKAFHYHNPNYQVLAKVVEVVSHERFGDYLQKHILYPLHMTGTSHADNVQQFFKAPLNLPKGNIYVLGRPLALSEPDWFVAGDAGIVSNAKDMAKWLADQMKTREGDSSAILPRKYLSVMQSQPAGNQFTYGMGWHVNPSAHMLYHSGVMWTYSSQQVILTDKGYGIVMLFNSGENPLVDYHSVLMGVQDILNGRTTDAGSIPPGLYSGAVITLFAIILIAGIRRMLRVKHWYINYNKRPGWKTCLYLLFRLSPFMLLLLLPYLVTLLSGRVLSYERIALMFMDVMIVLCLAALLNLLVVLLRIWYIFRRKYVVRAL
jgi:CubicO group peptidase (beta-lactamase class C family)